MWLTLRAASQTRCAAGASHTLRIALRRVVAHQDSMRSGAWDHLSAPPSVHSAAFAGAPRDSEVLSYLASCIRHRSPLVQRIRLGAFSCRLTPLTRKRLAPSQPGPQLAAKGSADHPCGDRLCAAPTKAGNSSVISSPSGWISKCAKVLSHPKSVTSCQRQIGDLNSQKKVTQIGDQPDGGRLCRPQVSLCRFPLVVPYNRRRSASSGRQ